MEDHGESDELLADLFAVFGALRREMRDRGVTGLGPSHHMVLMRLKEDGPGPMHPQGPRGPARVTELAQFLHLTPAAITQIVGDLEAKGLVLRERSSVDRRAVVVRLTPVGREALMQQRAQRRAVAEQILGQLTMDERRDLARIVRRMAGSHPSPE